MNFEGTTPIEKERRLEPVGSQNLQRFFSRTKNFIEACRSICGSERKPLAQNRNNLSEHIEAAPGNFPVIGGIPERFDSIRGAVSGEIAKIISQLTSGPA